MYARESLDDCQEAGRARIKFPFLLHPTCSYQCPTSLTLVLYELRKIISNIISGTIHGTRKRPMVYKLHTRWHPLRRNASRLTWTNPRRSAGGGTRFCERTITSQRGIMLAHTTATTSTTCTMVTFTSTRIPCTLPTPRHMAQLRALNYYSP